MRAWRPDAVRVQAGLDEVADDLPQALADRPAREQLRLRERLRPYVGTLMAEASRTGLPPMRPVFVDFPDDQRAWDCDDQYMFGPDLLVCPVTSHGARSRPVWLPAGTRWRDAWTGELHDGGTELDAAAPLERIPVFAPEGSALVPLLQL